MDQNVRKKAPSPKCSLKTPSPCRTFPKLRRTWGWLSEPQSLVTGQTRQYHDHGIIERNAWQNIHGSHGWTFPAGATPTCLLRHCHSKAHNKGCSCLSFFVETVGNCECYGFGISTWFACIKTGKTISKPSKNLWVIECSCPTIFGSTFAFFFEWVLHTFCE